MRLESVQRTHSPSSKPNRAYFQTSIEWLFCIVLIFSSYSVYFKKSQVLSAGFELTLIALAGILLLCLAFKQPRTFFNKKYFVVGVFQSLISLAVLLILFLARTGETEIGYFVQRIAFFPVLLPLCYMFMASVGYTYTVEVLLKKFTDCVFLLSAIGLPLWFLGNVGFSLPTITVEFAWGGTHSQPGILGLVFLQQTADVPFITGTWYRFTLFCVEASSANFLLLAALMIEIFLKRRPRLPVVLVLAVANFCVVSTLSMILTPLVIVGWALQSQSVRHLIRKNAVVAFLSYLFTAFCLFALPYWAISNISGKTNVASRNAHFNDIYAGMEAFLTYPLFGLGIQSGATEGFNDGRTGQTSGLLNTAAQGGILLLMLYLVPLATALYRSLKVRNFGFSIFSAVLGIFFFLALIENNPLFSVLLALCMVQPEKTLETAGRTQTLSVKAIDHIRRQQLTTFDSLSSQNTGTLSGRI